MSVHVGEVHTEFSSARPNVGEAGGTAPVSPRYPGAGEDEWRATRALVDRRHHRVRAEDFDD
ncbi:MAG: hypothetical protein QM695_16115 [Micropruina sp.]